MKRGCCDFGRQRTTREHIRGQLFVGKSQSQRRRDKSFSKVGDSLELLEHDFGEREQKELNAVEFIQPNCRGINEIWSKITHGLSIIKRGQISAGTRNSATSWYSQCLDNE